MTDQQETGDEAGGGDRRCLLYTLALDIPGGTVWRSMAKMLGSSVVRTLFGGDMVILHNGLQPVFMAGRRGLDEFLVETPVKKVAEMKEHAQLWKASAADSLDAGHYDWVMFLDADCLCLRNIDHLLAERDADILYQPERELPDRTSPRQGGVNPGVWAVRGSIYPAVMAEWIRLQMMEPPGPGAAREQSAWRRLIAEAPATGWRAEPFETHEIQFPLRGDRDWRLYKDAAIVHCRGAAAGEKAEFMFGLYMQKFFHDAGGTLLNVVEM